MESVAILRQLLGQLHELWDVYGSASHNHRRYLLDLENNSADEECSIARETKSSGFKMTELKAPASKRCRRERTHEELFTDASGVMEEKIWREFPEDLLERVIARLPIAAFFRFRSVCRSWNSLLNSHSFSQQCAEVLPKCPWFYTITHENVNNDAVYDPSLKKWYHLSLPLFPPKIIILPVASAGGLVCFLDIGHRNFYVCNPLTQSFRELPSRSVRVWSRVAVGMILNPNGIGYKLLWLGCAGDYEVYDSVENAWTRPGNMPSDIKLPLALNYRSQAITIDSVMYFMRTNPDGLVSYDLVKSTWQQLAIPPPLYSMDHTLAECKGQIMLVGLLTKNAATCVCIWELQKMTLLWKEVDRMPNMMCLDFYGKQVRMICLGNKGSVLLSLRSRQLNRLVLYDMSKKLWHRVPSCVLPRGRKRQWIACGTSFQPCLNASV
ncbi:F-box only protein 6 isoform X1 [Cryptomeria japonica]|uniref:F-box only protein 6 isoform X1 n=1 Tax=Cryptomeria japonica TaxID=3369 RepID=UPI0025AD7A0B|nr:F-box only protein 6 isoform X1 [Cryptomeria japonica]